MPELTVILDGNKTTNTISHPERAVNEVIRFDDSILSREIL
jgi:DMSO reductase anchor subunit